MMNPDSPNWSVRTVRVLYTRYAPTTRYNSSQTIVTMRTSKSSPPTTARVRTTPTHSRAGTLAPRQPKKRPHTLTFGAHESPRPVLVKSDQVNGGANGVKPVHDENEDQLEPDKEARVAQQTCFREPQRLAGSAMENAVEPIPRRGVDQTKEEAN